MHAIIAHHQPVYCRGIKEIIVSGKIISKVTIVHCYNEIIEKIKGEKKAFLIMDENLPEHDITDCLSWMLKIAPALKIIVLTLNEDAAYIRKIFNHGAKGCVFSDAGEEEFTEAINRTVNETYLSPCLTKYLIEEKTSEENAGKTIKETAKLSEREYEVYLLLRQKQKGKKIADQLCISPDTFKTHRRHLRKKLKKHKLIYLLDK